MAVPIMRAATWGCQHNRDLRHPHQAFCTESPVAPSPRLRQSVWQGGFLLL